MNSIGSNFHTTSNYWGLKSKFSSITNFAVGIFSLISSSSACDAYHPVHHYYKIPTDILYKITQTCVDGVVKGGACFTEAIAKIGEVCDCEKISYIGDDFEEISRWYWGSVKFERECRVDGNFTFESCVNELLNPANQCSIDYYNNKDLIIFGGVMGAAAGVCILGCSFFIIKDFIHRKCKQAQANNQV